MSINRKRKYIHEIDWTKMISASSVRNYMLDDPLIDWCKYYNITKITTKPNQTHQPSHALHLPQSHSEFIMNEGNKFEQNVYNYLKTKYNNRIVKVAESYEARSIEKSYSTIELMKQGVDIIYQGVIHDNTNMLYGCPDLMVRSDKINELFNILNKESSIPSSNLNTPFHYLIIDIKHSMLHFSHDKIHLLNINSVPAYKGQLLIYNTILGTIQGYKPDCSYILGKKWLNSDNDHIINLGTINYSNYDKDYIVKVNNAIEWITNMRQNGHTWKLLPKPSVSELYPNMKNNKDYPYNKLKIDLSKKIKEITCLWNCGIKKRKIAHSNKIYNWNNKRCKSINMGFNKTNTSDTLDNILKLNQKKKTYIRLDDLLKTDEWRTHGSNTMEIYIDFETINNNIGQVTEDVEANDFIFMIGIGWEENKQWVFKTFILEEMTNMSEYIMIKEMWDYITLKKTELNYTRSCFIHWTNAEVSFYNKFLQKHNTRTLEHDNICNINQCNFYDLHNLFLKNNIIVKGALDFKLKSIAGGMYSNRLIKSSWDKKNPCMNGLDAMFFAYNMYKLNTKINIFDKTIQNIVKYNEIDCKVMWEIYKYLCQN
jgi:hypothetical protein